MAHTVLMPQLGISEDSAILTRWHIRPGDTVKAGDKLFSLETGKSAFDVDSEHTGDVLALFAEEGDEVTVKAPVCVIGQKGEALPENPDSKASPLPAESSSGEAQSAGKAQTALPAPPSPSVSAARPKAVSPRAKRLAEKLGLDPSQAAPTGPEGRVIEGDIRRLAEEGSRNTEAVSGGAYADKALSNLRKIIAKNMRDSLNNTAQLTHTASFDASRLLALRKGFKANPETAGITLGDMVLYAVSRTLPDFPALNAHLLGDKLRLFSAVNLAVAVDTERGLMVPVLFAASQLTLKELSARLKTLAEQCRQGSVPPEQLSGGSFTVSNLGQFGIEHFTPILNPPQTGILGVNTITQRVRVVDGCIGAYPSMSLSLTYDHRALDGAPASRFLQTLCKVLEGFDV